ncbi:hypothetical protein COR50_12990 [Chitinophaga caeni]|uniref:Uncharacterized protein n=1 Tax=Chitinophaga caeni TaxID=2029983 RepID=A0A291QVP6_9BACT|nr:hypothetical protein [Chitinophaga caeni]ATL48007.1 hypothetical protein COR50_12990 [Chitinophaga caeni]
MKTRKHCLRCLLVLTFPILIWSCSKDSDGEPLPSDLQTLYSAAVKDAMVAEDDEIANNLMILSGSNPAVKWKTIHGQEYVLMATYMKYPGSYPAGDSITNTWGESWVFVPGQMKTKLNGRFTASSDTTLRINQLLGLPPLGENSNTHIAQVWVKLSNVYRPAGNPSVLTNSATYNLVDNVSQEYATWFDNYIIFAYYRSLVSATAYHYPWTRMGYTYDWAPGESEKNGLSEFVIMPNSGLWVESVQTASAFLAAQ